MSNYSAPPTPAPWFKMWRTHSCVPRSHSCERVFSALFFTFALAHSQPLDTLARDYHDNPGPRTHTAVLAFANAHPKDVNGALALLVLGSVELDAKQFNDAAIHLKAAAKRLPTLADYPAYLEAAAQFELRRFDEALKTLKPVWDNSPASPLVVKAILLEANAYLNTAEPKRVLSLMEKRGSDLPPEKTALLLAKAYEATGDRKQATAQYQRIYIEYPFTSEAADAHASLARFSPPSAHARLVRCSKLIDGRGFAAARTELEALLPSLTGEDADTARVLIGVTDYAKRNKLEAFTYLKSLNVTAAEPAAERLFYLEESARRLDRIDEMDAAVAQLARSYPTSKWRLQANVAVGTYYLIKGQPAQYEPLFRACAETFPGNPQAADCHWRIAWGEYLKNRANSDSFVAHLKQYGQHLEGHTSGSLYFLGRIAESKNDFGAARVYYERLRADFPNQYYGVLARDRLKESTIAQAAPSPQASALLAAMKFPHQGDPRMNPSPVTQARISRARLLASAGLDDLADSELRFGAKSDGQPQIAAVEMARMALERDEPNHSIQMIKRYAAGYLWFPLDSTTEALWKLAFPLPFWKSLTTYSEQRGIDPYMLAALIREESEFDAKIVSYANAYGLTQVLPSTGRAISRQLKMRAFTARMLFDPEVNLNIGTFFLRNLLDSLNGKWEPTLASYNAGPGRVVKWLNSNKYREPAEFVESIPIAQTRIYVQSILRDADVYRRLYSSGPPLDNSHKPGAY
jgi:soluble lytic murein transglycosylase